MARTGSTISTKTAHMGERIGVEFKDGTRSTGRLTAFGSRVVRWRDRDGVLREADKVQIIRVISFDR